MTEDRFEPPSISLKMNAPLAVQLASVDDLRSAAVALDVPPSGRGVLTANADTLEAIARLSASLTPAEMRDRATLVFRCQDCRGRAIAWVSWIAGRPLFIGASTPGRMTVALLDECVFTPPAFRCRAVKWSFSWPLADIPGPGARPVNVRVSHDD